MTPRPDLTEAVVAAWKTNNRVTVFLFENLPAELWPMAVPGMSRRTVRMIAVFVSVAVVAGIFVGQPVPFIAVAVLGAIVIVPLGYAYVGLVMLLRRTICIVLAIVMASLACSGISTAQTRGVSSVTAAAGVAFKSAGEIGQCCGPFRSGLERSRAVWVAGGVSRRALPRVNIDVEAVWAREPRYTAFVLRCNGDSPERVLPRFYLCITCPEGSVLTRAQRTNRHRRNRAEAAHESR
jgi:hypothetical protein